MAERIEGHCQSGNGPVRRLDSARRNSTLNMIMQLILFTLACTMIWFSSAINSKGENRETGNQVQPKLWKH